MELKPGIKASTESPDITISCTLCDRRFQPREVPFRCSCGGLLDLKMNSSFPRNLIEARPHDLWRYREAIPIQDDRHIVSFHEGMTPLIPLEIKGRSVLIKQDHLFPSGSFKDRGATVLVSALRQAGISQVVEDSSGNAGAAIALYCARAGILCDIFVPEHTSTAKLLQISRTGARVFPIPGTRQDTAEAAMFAALTSCYASHAWNPYFLHGTKTVAFEICEQLGWRAPDSIVVPVGNGTLLLGAFIGFEELRAAGIIDRLPKIFGVQAARCNPLARLSQNQAMAAVDSACSPTIAEGIAVARPVRASQILSAVRQTGGRFISIEEEEILTTLHSLWRQGFYVEPTAAATIAGLDPVLMIHEKNAVVVSVITGHGLKHGEPTIDGNRTTADPREPK